MPGIWDYLMTPPHIRERRKWSEQDRKQREQLAKTYGIENSREGIAYISGQIDKIEDAFKAWQARTTQPEQPKPSELLKEEGARKELRVGGMMERVLPGLIGAHGKERFVEMAEPQVGRSTLETLGIVRPKPKVEKVKTEKKLSEGEKAEWVVEELQKGRNIEELRKEKPGWVWQYERRQKKKGSLSLDDFWEEYVKGDTTRGAISTDTARPEDAFIQEIKSKNITTIHWDKIAEKHPDWDIEYIKEKLYYSN